MFGQLNAGASDWAGHVAKTGVTGKAYKIFVAKAFRETLGIQRRMDNIKGGWM
jgi:hypothetical protein